MSFLQKNNDTLPTLSTAINKTTSSLMAISAAIAIGLGLLSAPSAQAEQVQQQVQQQVTSSSIGAMVNEQLTTPTQLNDKSDNGNTAVSNNKPSNLSEALPDQLLGKALNQTREQVIAQKQAQVSAAGQLEKSARFSHSFSIYRAFSELLDDVDGDGYYSTFSVTFDADVDGFGLIESADVYAELYLSRDGGPWLHYFTTDAFTIVNDNESDSYEVVTTLRSGYFADGYDVLIDLYEVGYSDIVASISSDDTNGLYALPLESADRDPRPNTAPSTQIQISESHGHGGSSSVLVLLTLMTLLVARYTKARKTQS